MKLTNENFRLVEVHEKPSRRYRKGSKYDPIIDKFMSGKSSLVKVEVEGKMKGKRMVKLTFPRQMLHAGILGFTHPVTEEYLEFSVPVPEDMTEKIRELRETEAD